MYCYRLITSSSSSDNGSISSSNEPQSEETIWVLRHIDFHILSAECSVRSIGLVRSLYIRLFSVMPYAPVCILWCVLRVYAVCVRASEHYDYVITRLQWVVYYTTACCLSVFANTQLTLLLPNHSSQFARTPKTFRFTERKTKKRKNEKRVSHRHLLYINYNRLCTQRAWLCRRCSCRRWRWCSMLLVYFIYIFSSTFAISVSKMNSS